MCKNGETKQGKSVITLTKGKLVFTLKNVPAQICHDCGEEYINEDTTKLILQTANESFNKGVGVDLRDWDKFSTV